MLLRQVSRFAIVGVTATAIHSAVAATTHGVFSAGPLLANLLGYVSAVGVSYVGNAYWAFEGSGWNAAQASRFVAVSLSGLLLNQGITFVATHVLGLPFWFALGLVITAVPVFTFILSKLWVFRRPAT